MCDKTQVTHPDGCTHDPPACPTPALPLSRPPPVLAPARPVPRPAWQARGRVPTRATPHRTPRSSATEHRDFRVPWWRCRTLYCLLRAPHTLRRKWGAGLEPPREHRGLVTAVHFVISCCLCLSRGVTLCTDKREGKWGSGSRNLLL